MTSPKFTSNFGPVRAPTPAELAAIRATIAEHAQDTDDAALLCDALGVA